MVNQAQLTMIMVSATQMNLYQNGLSYFIMVINEHIYINSIPNDVAMNPHESLSKWVMNQLFLKYLEHHNNTASLPMILF